MQAIIKSIKTDEEGEHTVAFSIPTSETADVVKLQLLLKRVINLTITE